MSLCTALRHIERKKVWLHAFLISALDGGQVDIMHQLL